MFANLKKVNLYQKKQADGFLSNLFSKIPILNKKYKIYELL